ncbi:hypothetical protein LR48_Vigan10g242200 [Vigna angularis]|uniref:Uncharacterized protein n=1 Tax=Phaseolus angularis TaxID=3914 RepID=A0A0L9VNA4_PHAAN|nr:hypothetical protein LR48_Vigan10g242200 [Vigna angularis]
MSGHGRLCTWNERFKSTSPNSFSQFLTINNVNSHNSFSLNYFLTINVSLTSCMA